MHRVCSAKVLILLSVLTGIVFQACERREETEVPAPSGKTISDSLSEVVFDLTTELHSRSLGVLLSDDPLLPPPGLPFSIPVPKVPDVPPPTDAELRAARLAVADGELGRIDLSVMGSSLPPRARDALVSTGFRLATEAADSPRPDSTVRPRINTLVAGDSVDIAATRLIALELLAAGVPLSRVRRTGVVARAHVVELRHTPHASDVTPLTVFQINSLRRSRPSTHPEQ